jgi:hypothetical protein
MVGERDARLPLQPRGQIVGGGLRGAGRVLVAARSGLLGQVGAGAQGRRQSRPAH